MLNGSGVISTWVSRGKKPFRLWLFRLLCAMYNIGYAHDLTIYTAPALSFPTVCGYLRKTNGATAVPNMYSALEALHLYLLPPHNNHKDNSTPRATSWGICWWGTTHFSPEKLNTELHDIQSCNLCSDSSGRSKSCFQISSVSGWHKEIIYTYIHIYIYILGLSALTR